MRSFAGATDAMASRSEIDGSGAGFRPRLISALCFGPVILAIVYLGPPLSDLGLALAGCLMMWEWLRVMRAVEAWRSQWSWLSLLPALVVLCVAGYLPPAALAAIPLGLLLAFSFPAPEGSQTGSPRLWLLAGLAYVCAPLIALQWLRNELEGGLVLVFLLLACVWASDSAAYLGGRAIGGPKLFPRISPKKTWSGGLVGVIAGSLAWLVGTMLYGEANVAVAVLTGCLLSVVCMFGDLAESALKRRFGVKDSGKLIPGHGGILDRVDGLMFAAVALAGMAFLWGSPLSWQWT